MKHLALTIIFYLIFYQFSLAQSEFTDDVIHIGVVVEDLDKSIDFYTRIMGMAQAGGFNLNDDFAKRSGLNEGKGFQVVVLKLEDAPGATQWKLMSFGKKAAHPKQNYVPDDTGMQYITINVNSLKPFLERFKANDIRMLGETPTEINEKVSFILVQDPDGTFIEVIGAP